MSINIGHVLILYLYPWNLRERPEAPNQVTPSEPKHLVVVLARRHRLTTSEAWHIRAHTNGERHRCTPFDQCHFVPKTNSCIIALVRPKHQHYSPVESHDLHSTYHANIIRNPILYMFYPDINKSSCIINIRIVTQYSRIVFIQHEYTVYHLNTIIVYHSIFHS